MNYQYWNDFIEEWKNFVKNSPIPTSFTGYSQLNKWNYPKDIKGSINSTDNTVCFFPEPWWGNDGTHDLHSVVINYNPGKGGDIQNANKTPNIQKITSYGDFIKNNVSAYIHGKSSVSPYLKDTCNWHNKKRAGRIFIALNKILKPYVQYKLNLHNHLSVELIPWHTSSVNNNFHEYVAENRYVIFENCIKFAAESAARILNPILRNVVIVRMSSGAFKQCLGGIGGFNYLRKETNIKSGNYCFYEFTQIPNIIFVCIWGSRSRNNFPSEDTLTDIFKEIVLYKLNH